MTQIFIDTDNSKLGNKLYDGLRAGKAAQKAEEKMQKMVRRVVDKATGFTTAQADDAKGFAIRLALSQVQIVGANTKCSLSGSIVRFPLTGSKSKAASKGEEMVSTSMTGSATATGTDEMAVLDCVEAIAESLTAKAIPIMRTDFAARNP